ncbi:LCP family protein [Streptomyces sp. NPDC090108]|uniref:LCP family protein n=1 Tax=Streptomyces sp. NPDC090108 TaxID=3365947 RepID=UPI00380CDF66
MSRRRRGAAAGEPAEDAVEPGPEPEPEGRAARRKAGRRPAAQAPAGRGARRRAQSRPKRKGLRIVALVTGMALVVGGGAVAYLYFQLAGNIKSEASFTGDDKAAALGVEKADPFGRTPLNLMLIGSDTRGNAKDCKLGGACGDAAGARADVEMLVHFSADRSNISVMSIPRDLMTQLPECTDPKTQAHTAGGFGQINSTLQYGPGCTDTAIHKLTGIPVDGFAMVDFGGVIDMSNAVGGVNMCFTDRLYDKNSGLKLTKGWHDLKGKAALQFLRTRDSFGDGSDNVGRTSATHLFFTGMINQLKKAGTFTDLPALYKIANAATNALTVSDNLDTPLKLVNLARELNKVPTNRITFTTMKNTPDTTPGLSGKVLEAADAHQLFDAIADDQPLTKGKSSSKKTSSDKAQASAAKAAANVVRSTVAVSVENGTTVSGRAADVLAALKEAGYSQESTSGTSGTPASATSLTYGPGQSAAAQSVAGVLGLPAKSLHQGTSDGLVLVIGPDWQSGTTFGKGAVKKTVDTQAALSGTHSQTAGTDRQCVPVSTEYTQPGHTPQMMFDDHPEVPDSAS